jgi:disulfide oxidoreductase YuzD
MEIECIGCKNTLSLSNFYKHKAGVYGILHRCKKCIKIQRSKNYEERTGDPCFVKAEQQRNREKYVRLNYKDINREKMQDPARKLKHRIRTAAYSLLNKKINSSTLLGCSHNEILNI